MDYIVVTVCKNEGQNLPLLYESLMVKQTIKPLLWLVVDDGSEDNTFEFMKEINEDPSIQYIRQYTTKRDIGIHLSKMIKDGFDLAIQKCNENKIDFDYICNIDGDMILAPDFFEKINISLKKENNLGIASGSLYHKIKGDMVREKIKNTEPSGSTLIISKECYNDCSGIIVSRAWESALIAKAKLLGWNTKRIEEAISIETRLTNSAEGLWKGFAQKGRGACYLGYPILHAMLKGIIFTLKAPHYTGIAFIYGYCTLYIKNEKIEDSDVRKYYQKVRPKEIRKHYISKIQKYIKKDDYEI